MRGDKLVVRPCGYLYQAHVTMQKYKAVEARDEVCCLWFQIVTRNTTLSKHWRWWYLIMIWYLICN